jgi:aminoglycoside phosphotransferase (APT) family kinase protein
MFGTQIISVDWEARKLHGGTVGNVILVTGTVVTAAIEKLPYKVVLKTQNKWERRGDPGSWRREYDLYKSDLGKLFTDSLRWPECYHMEMNGDETEWTIWFEYIDGVSGNDLTTEMRECAAMEWGRFQGRLYKNPEMPQNISCFSQIENIKRYLSVHRPKTDEYRYVYSDNCELPAHLRQMLLDSDMNIKDIYDNTNKFPVVLCHRDFWHENIIYSNGKIILLDWDCTGWGYMFEDIIQLIVDETDAEYIDEYYRKFIPAYLKGFSEYAEVSDVKDLYLNAWKITVIWFGFTLVNWYINARSAEEKNLSLNILQNIYEMRDRKIEF